MRVVGHRRHRQPEGLPSGQALAEGARFNEALARLGTTTGVPKGVYRFRSHEDANRHQEACLARGMARRAQRHG